MHYQNLADRERYYQEIESNEKLPLGRGFVPTTHQRLIRELILLLKRGYLDVSYFKEKFDVDITEVFSEQWAALKEDGDAVVQGNLIELTQQGCFESMDYSTRSLSLNFAGSGTRERAV